MELLQPSLSLADAVITNSKAKPLAIPNLLKQRCIGPPLVWVYFTKLESIPESGWFFVAHTELTHRVVLVTPIMDSQKTLQICESVCGEKRRLLRWKLHASH
jgi:hypothetical protein